jgi:hypothetical protein
MVIKRHPYRAVATPITPIAVVGGSGAIPFAHEKESTVFAPTAPLGSMVKSDLPLISNGLRLDEIDSFFVCPATIAQSAGSLYPLYGLGCVRIASVPNTRQAFVLSQKHAAHFFEKIKPQMGQFALQTGEVEKSLNILVVRHLQFFVMAWIV